MREFVVYVRKLVFICFVLGLGSFMLHPSYRYYLLAIVGLMQVINMEIVYRKSYVKSISA